MSVQRVKTASHTSFKQQMSDYYQTYPQGYFGTYTEIDNYVELLPNDSSKLKDECRKLKELLIYQHELLRKMKIELEIEQGRIKILKSENEQLRKHSVEWHAEKEQEEEQITNKLLRHINGLKKEKSQILTQMEQEEEYIANTLQKRLAQIQKEKIELEIAMEQEQEFIVNRLNKQLDELRRTRGNSPIGSSMSLNHPPAITLPDSQVAAEIGDEDPKKLKDKLNRLEKEHDSKIQLYQIEIQRLKEQLKQSRSMLSSNTSIHTDSLRPASSAGRNSLSSHDQ